MLSDRLFVQRGNVSRFGQIAARHRRSALRFGCRRQRRRGQRRRRRRGFLPVVRSVDQSLDELKIEFSERTNERKSRRTNSVQLAIILDDRRLFETAKKRQRILLTNVFRGVVQRVLQGEQIGDQIGFFSVVVVSRRFASVRLAQRHLTEILSIVFRRFSHEFRGELLGQVFHSLVEMFHLFGKIFHGSDRLGRVLHHFLQGICSNETRPTFFVPSPTKFYRFVWECRSELSGRCCRSACPSGPTKRRDDFPTPRVSSARLDDRVATCPNLLTRQTIFFLPEIDRFYFLSAFAAVGKMAANSSPNRFVWASREEFRRVSCRSAGNSR